MEIKKLSDAEIKGIERFIQRPLRDCLKDLEVMMQWVKIEQNKAEKTLQKSNDKEQEDLALQKCDNCSEYFTIYNNIKNQEKIKSNYKQHDAMTGGCTIIAIATIMGLFKMAIPDYIPPVETGIPIMVGGGLVFAKNYLASQKITANEKELIEQLVTKFCKEYPKRAEPYISKPEEKHGLVKKVVNTITSFKQKPKEL